MTLRSRVIVRLCVGPLFLAAMLFVPAGSLKYWQAWSFIAAIVPSAIFSFVYFYRRDPGLVQRRMQSKEPVREQRLLVNILKPLFFVAFLIPGLDYRFGWSRKYLGGMPAWLSLVALAIVVGGYFFVVWVFRVNSFASRTIRVEQRQTVISTGPYALVRHPMYLGSVAMCLAVPLALGSYFAWPLFALLTVFYVLRLLNEEKILREQLAGYAEYCLRTRYRLVPFMW
jgi:protein-S-isoprenylcysteine O-methyltransferase Ste14